MRMQKSPCRRHPSPRGPAAAGVYADRDVLKPRAYPAQPGAGCYPRGRLSLTSVVCARAPGYVRTKEEYHTLQKTLDWANWLPYLVVWGRGTWCDPQDQD